MSPYKDKDKQREVNREKARRYRIKKASPLPSPPSPPCVTPNVRPLSNPDRDVLFYKEQNELLLAENKALRAELDKLKEVKHYPLEELRQVIKKIETSTPLKADPNLPPLYT